MACDYRVAAAGSRFGQPEVRLGIMPGFGGCKRLEKTVGSSRAKELVFSGRIVDAVVAERIGLVDEVTDDGAVMNRALAVSAAFNENSLFAIQQAKRMFQAKNSADYAPYGDAEYSLFSQCFSHPDQREGMEAFLLKCAPHFQNHTAHSAEKAL